MTPAAHPTESRPPSRPETARGRLACDTVLTGLSQMAVVAWARILLRATLPIARRRISQRFRM